MSEERAVRRPTGDPDLDRRLVELLDGRVDNAEDRDLLFEMLATVLRLADDHTDRLNLKISSAALREMRQAFRVFAPYRHVPKVTIFGSARTLPDDPLYRQARDLAAALARAGWMVVTGAGPGIMAAGSEGAGREWSIGVNIRLPFEQVANRFIAADRKLVSMKYFFTRKLMLMKESAGFVVLPGGFGTLDEMYELLTLLQTGKAAPAPLVLLDVPGGTYWRAWRQFVHGEVAARGFVDEDDLLLAHLTQDVDEAVGEVLGFYRNYHSMRFVGARLVIRLRAAPADQELDRLNREFGEICTEGTIERTGPLPREAEDVDHLDLPRIVLRFDRMQYGRLRALIRALNELDTAPPLALPDLDATEAAGSPPEDEDAETPATLEPAVAELVARAESEREDHALDAVAALAALVNEGTVAPDQQRALLARLFDLVLSSRTGRVRRALLDLVGAMPPAAGLDAVLDLLEDHRRTLGDEELAVLLGALGRMLEAVDGEAERAATDAVERLRLGEVRGILDDLAGRAGPVGEAARPIAERVGRLPGV